MSIDDVHVMPVADWREHHEERECWCKPSVVEDDAGGEIVVHNAMDERETYERGRKLH